MTEMCSESCGSLMSIELSSSLWWSSVFQLAHSYWTTQQNHHMKKVDLSEVFVRKLCMLTTQPQVRRMWMLHISSIGRQSYTWPGQALTWRSLWRAPQLHELRSAVESSSNESGHRPWHSWKDMFWVAFEPQFVMKRVIKIRSLVPLSNCRHCPGTQNTADIHCMINGQCLHTWEGYSTERIYHWDQLIHVDSLTVLLPCEDYSCLKRQIRVAAIHSEFSQISQR